MMPKRAHVTNEEPLSDEELIARAKADPESRKQLLALADRVASGNGQLPPGIGREELTEFLNAIRREVGSGPG